MQTANNRLLIVAPYRDEEAFLDTLSRRLDAHIELLNYRTHPAVSRSIWRRHAMILLMAIRAFRRSGDKDLILFGEQFVGLYYALFCRLFFWQRYSRRPSRTMVLQLIYNRKAGWSGRCYRKLYRWLLASPALDILVCHASLEREYYRAEFGESVGRKILFIPFGRFAPDTSEAPRQGAEERYFFSGGTSNRDYRTLVEAFRNTGERLVIACHANDLKGIELPENVTARHDVFGPAFQEHIDKAYAVILPILRTDVSAGQLVLLDAMRSGKASIVTKGSCMEDYVDQSCAIRVRQQDAQKLGEAVRFLAANEPICQRLGHHARLRYERQFTRQAFAERISQVMHSGIRRDQIEVRQVLS